MSDLDEVWTWYEETKKSLQRLERLASKHWDGLPWDGDGTLARDAKFRELEAEPVAESARLGLRGLDDLAVVRLFATFEAAVRRLAAREVEALLPTIHVALKEVARAHLDEIERGSFAKVLAALRPYDPDLVDQVRQIRSYRNHVAHGGGGDPMGIVHPERAYKILGRYLRQIEGGDQAGSSRVE